MGCYLKRRIHEAQVARVLQTPGLQADTLVRPLLSTLNLQLKSGQHAKRCA